MADPVIAQSTLAETLNLIPEEHRSAFAMEYLEAINSSGVNEMAKMRRGMDVLTAGLLRGWLTVEALTALTRMLEIRMSAVVTELILYQQEAPGGPLGPSEVRQGYNHAGVLSDAGAPAQRLLEGPREEVVAELVSDVLPAQPAKPRLEIPSLKRIQRGTLGADNVNA